MVEGELVETGTYFSDQSMPCLERALIIYERAVC